MTEQERKDTQKAMAYDLSWIFRREPGKTYTPEELDIAAKIAELERQNQEFAAKVAAMEEEEALMEEAERRCCRGSRRWIASHPSFSPPFRNAS